MIASFQSRLETLIRNRTPRPILHGAIAAWCGCSLEAAERELEAVLEAGRLRRLTVAELRAEGWRSDVVAYVGP
jgi:hypothetical protein